MPDTEKSRLDLSRRTKTQLIEELNNLRRQVQDLQREALERHRTDKSLRESEERLRSAARIAKVGHWLWDEVEDELTYCSDEFARIHGVSTEEYLASGTSWEDDLKWVHPDDRERYSTTILESIQQGSSFEIEYRIITKQDEVRHIREIGEPILDADGVAASSFGTIQDITDRKRIETELRESEAHYREIFDEGPSALWIEDWSEIKKMIDRRPDRCSGPCHPCRWHQGAGRSFAGFVV